MIYVVSNIHGDYDKFKRLLSVISFKESDIMYILGDIVDYGEQPMEVINEISVRYNVYPIVGEHDYKAVRMLMKFDKFLSGNADPDGDYVNEMKEWVADGGMTTMSGYRDLDAEMREGVVDYLSDMSLYEEVEVKGKKYLLIHAGIAGFKQGMTTDSLADLDPEAFISEPLDLTRRYFDGVTVIVGHVSTTDNGGKIFYGNGSIAIDCGVKDGGALGCLCLDTGKEYYVQ